MVSIDRREQQATHVYVNHECVFFKIMNQANPKSST